MTRNYLANYDLLAVSANLKETALNTEQTLDTSMLIDKSNILQLDKRRENNADELTGKEEPDTVYDLGALSMATLDFPKAQAQHFAFGLAFGLGTISTAAWGTGYKHTITPTSNIDNPTLIPANERHKFDPEFEPINPVRVQNPDRVDPQSEDNQ